ncbi:MAG: dTDP-4-dehydrorhamnose 3,5-epimerase family protein [Myxococcota bacterium]
MRKFKKGEIEGVAIKSAVKHKDERGFLAEIYRNDEVPDSYRPVMAYLSVTNPGIARGPHEHNDQYDYFFFVGPGEFKVTLWDNRKQSPTYDNKMEIIAGESDPKIVVVPPGVVHAYRCISKVPGQVINAPNRLFKGEGRREPVDEIRWETRDDNPFELD